MHNDAETRREKGSFQQLWLEIPLPPPPARQEREKDERDRGVAVLDIC